MKTHHSTSNRVYYPQPSSHSSKKSSAQQSLDNLSDGLKKMLSSGAKSHNLEAMSPAQKQRAHMAGLYSMAAFFDQNHRKNGKTIKSSADVMNSFIGITKEDARTVLKLSRRHLNTAEKLAAQFPHLGSNAHKLLSMLDKLNINLYKHHETNEIISAARGTASRSDAMQDIVTGFGLEGEKYKALDSLVTLFHRGGIRPNLYTGNSLGGGIAKALANKIGDHSAEVITFDAQRHNHKQHRNSLSNNVPISSVDYSMKSMLTLQSLMNNPMFKKGDRVRLEKDSMDTLNPVKQLAINHSTGTITSHLSKRTSRRS